MPEPSLPGAADRLTPNDPSGLQRRLTALLQSSPAPTICAARQGIDGGDVIVAGAPLLEHVRTRIAALQRSGMRRGDILASGESGIGRVVDALASILGEFTYWPCSDQRRVADGALVSDSRAPLIWRPNPLVGVSLSPGLPHEPPAALPMRLSIALDDLMRPCGPQVRVLCDADTTSVAPFAVNAQTIARLGSTMRRRLAIRRQSIRYCAAPAESAAGVLLDLLPGIAARQVIVIPNELHPSSTTIVRAIARYRPDSLTLTRAQSEALIGTPIDDDARTVLQQVSLLIADTGPIPTDLRAHLATLVSRVNVAYILPEAGDVVLM